MPDGSLMDSSVGIIYRTIYLNKKNADAFRRHLRTQVADGLYTRERSFIHLSFYLTLLL